MKKILFVTNFFGNGGAARVMSIISNTLLESNKYNVDIVSFIKFNNEYKFPNGTNHYYLNSKNKIFKIIELRKIIKKNKYDIIISFEYFINMYTIIAMLFMKTNLIISERNDPNESGNDKKNIRNFLYRFCNVLVCQTEDAKDYFPSYIRKKTVVIPNPIMDNLPNRYIGKREKVIVTFCRITEQKNLPMLLDAFLNVSKVHDEYILKIYGDGPEKNDIINYINKLKLNNKVELLPFCDDIHNIILKCSMFVSSSDFEGISNSMIEAMGIGLPTICTDCPCGGARMMIKDHINGILVPVRDIKKLTEAILEVIENDKLAEKLSSNAIKIKDEISSEKISKQWIKIMKEEK